MADPDGRKTITVMNNLFEHLDDESLIRQTQDGEHEAFTTLVNRHTRRFYSMAYRIVFNKDDAEDIVQEAFLKLWVKKELWDPNRQAKFTTWFYKVVTNLCLDANRKKKPLLLSEEVPLADKSPGQEAIINHRQEQVMLDRFIQELPERQQLALNLCFYEGVSNQEAADTMGLKVKALQSLIMRAKSSLKEKIQNNLVRGTR